MDKVVYSPIPKGQHFHHLQHHHQPPHNGIPLVLDGSYRTDPAAIASPGLRPSSSSTSQSDYSPTTSSRNATYSDFIGGARYYTENPEHSSAQSSIASSRSLDGYTFDSKMTAPSPSYSQGGSYSQYPPQPGHEMSQQGYPPHAHPGWRPEWGPYPQTAPQQQQQPNYANMQQHQSPAASLSNQSSPSTASRPIDKSRRKRLSTDNNQHPLNHTQQVYSFVPIPGAQQHKRPRRRYEEIERMYKCGFNGCEKAYGTLNHLNAHVTMQTHGQKRTPEEFKDIRKEWKARKKDEDAARKAEDEQARQQRQADNGAIVDPSQQLPNGASQYAAPRQLPPLAYQQQQHQPAPVPGMHHYAPTAGAIDGMQSYPPQNGMYAGYPHSTPYPHAPSQQQQQQMYQSRQAPVHPGSEETDADAEPDPDVPNYAHP